MVQGMSSRSVLGGEAKGRPLLTMTSEEINQSNESDEQERGRST